MAKNNPQKVFHVTECFAYGTAKSLKQLCGLLKHDYEITLFYCHRDGTNSELQDIDADITLVEMASQGPFRHIKNILKVHSLIDESTYAIHGHSSYGGLYARLAAIGKNVPFVFYSPRAYAFLRQDLNIITRYIFLLAEICLSFLGHTVTCGMAEFKVGKKFTRCITNINNSVTIKDRPKAPDSKHFKVISVGRICHQKAFDTFLEVASKLKNIEFTWVGSSDPCYFESIINKHKKLPENITIIEYIGQPELFEKISQSSLIFHPSRWEGLSRILIESLALGMPIVTSTCQPNLDCLHPRHEHDVSGEYENGFACNSVDDYISAIQTLKSKPELIAQMGESSFTLAKQYFDLDTTKVKWLKLYRGEL